MKYNFDEIVNRWGTDSVKFDGPKQELGADASYIPLWVADMDFKTPQPILDSITKRVEGGVLGYTFPSEKWSKSICTWAEKRYQWNVTPNQLIYTPGIVRGLTFAIRCFTAPNDEILMMSPVYPPFFNVPNMNERVVKYHKLAYNNQRYEVDFIQFEQDVKGCKLFILCNPHNPGGRVWSREELIKMADICERNGVLVVSDEIHADLTLPPHKHIAFATVSEQAKKNSITFMSPSKAFNMAGLASSYAIIQEESILKKYKTFVEALDVVTGNLFAYDALVAAYEECADWLPQVCSYIQGNIMYVKEYLHKYMPRIKMIDPEASFLIFLDCRELGLTDDELQELFVKKAGLILNPGISFGEAGSGFMRLNIGCPQSVLTEALDKLKAQYDLL